MGMAKARAVVEDLANRYDIPRAEAARLALKYIRRANENTFTKGWWLELLDAQFHTHIGPHKRIRCGQERHLTHLSPDAGELCHDCGCTRDEYHVFGCDSEECSNCGEQAFCCACDDASEQRPTTTGP